ncbi:MAG TPA: hypothetical protein VLS90_11245 [Thermodesulfobacteriota bacterium]|nr:hypothetical protein [Thermodesulfobacteriota bacterium]
MSMRNSKPWIVLAVAAAWVFSIPSADSFAGVNVSVNTPGLSVNIGTPPPVVIPAPPPMAVIPGTYVYMAPNVGADILFYHGHWYRPHDGHWFIESSYNGPWAHCPPPQVPKAILHLPPGHQRVPPGQRHIPYEHVKNNWKKWEREKHWEHDRDWAQNDNGGPGHGNGRGHGGGKKH